MVVVVIEEVVVVVYVCVCVCLCVHACVFLTSELIVCLSIHFCMRMETETHTNKKKLKKAAICSCYSPQQMWIIDRGCSSIIFCITVELNLHHQRAGASNWTTRCHGNYALIECGGFMKKR